MKQKFTYLLFLLTFSSLLGLGSLAKAQSVTGTPSTTGCKAGGTIVAVPTGLGATPQFQLLKGGVVVMPVGGDATQFTNNATFTSLQSGTDYTLKARAIAGGTVYTSANITITNGYTDMALNTPTKVLTCTGGTVALTTTITGGKGDYTYSIATQAAPLTPLQTSAATSALTFTFNALPAGSYLVSVSDNCGVTSTGATSISNPTVSLAGIKLGSGGYVNRLVPTNCTSNFTMTNELGFRYISSSAVLSAADAALFTWKIKFQGVLYGQDTDADGFSDVGGAGFPALTNTARMPLVATRNAILADEPNTKIVLIDACGNQKEFSIINYNKTSSYVRGQNRCGNAEVTVRIGAGMSCLPINFVFTNTTNPADVVTITQTAATQALGGFTAGATYSFTYVDGAGYTSGLYPTSSVSIPAAPEFNPVQFMFGTQQSLNNLNYGLLGINLTPAKAGDPVTATVTASSNPLVNVGASVSGVLDGNFNIYLPRINATDPVGFWPKGNYTLSIASGCSTKLINVVVQGYNASLSGYTATPICGGFNYVMNGAFDVASAYQVIIVSGPSAGDVGQVRDLASTSASLPFNGLGPGTYVFGLRIKGGSTNVLTQTVVYNATSVITIDRNNTGGFVCSAGATNGTLTVAATSASPAPGNVLQYALSADGGVTYGAYQAGNTFSGLGAGTYYFKVKDGCGNEITSSAQISVAAAPTATANGLPTTADVCKTVGGTMTLNVDAIGAGITYEWSGPGISNTVGDPAYKGLKSPVIGLDGLTAGLQNYSVSVLNPVCSATASIANLTVRLNALPTLVIVAPMAVCYPNTVDITAAAVTAGSDPTLTYTYFIDAAGLIPLPNPATIAVSNTYYIKATNGSCENIKPVLVTIDPLPIASISYASAPYCKRGTATVTQTGQAAGTYTSDAGLAINATTGAIDLLNSTTGSHIVTYTFTNGSCGSSTTTTITINATTLPTALADINAVCSATPTAPTINDPCAGVLTATTTTVFPITTVGTTVVTWSFDYGNGFTQTVNQNVIITSPVAPSITAASATSFCAGGSVDLSSTAATAYRWYKDGILIAGATSQIYNATTSGNYSVEIGNGTCYSVASVATTVTVNPTPATPTVTAATATTFCTGGSVILNSSSATGNQWYKDGVIITGETNQTYTANTTGSYTVVVTTTGCPSAPSVGTTVTVNPTPAKPTVTAATATTFCTGGSVILSSSSATGNQWYKDGVIITGETNQTFTASATGNYTVVVTTTGCPSAPSAAITVIVNALPTAPVVSVAPASCTAVGTATISNYVSANTYTFNPSGPVVGAGGLINGMIPGVVYTVSTNNDNCNSAASASFSIEEMLPMAVAPTVTTTAATCTAVGTATLSNYVSSNTYIFSPTGPVVGVGGLISGMIPGTSYTVITNNGSCSSPASSPFSIGAMLPTPIASISYNPNEYQAVGIATVIQSGQTGGTYTASPVGLSINPTTGEIDLAASTPNQSYTVMYSFSNGNCTGTATTTVRLSSTPATIAYANPAYCAVGTASVIRTGPQGGTYSASPTGLSINVATGEVNLVTSKPGLYTITYSYQDGTITSSSTTTITVNALPVVTISTDIATGNSIPLGDVVTLTASGGVTYSWTGDDIQSGQNTNVIKVRPRQATTYKVTVTNSNGCSQTMELTISVVAGVKFTPNNVITPNGDGRNDVWVVKNLDYYPKNTVTIYDRAGRKVYSMKAYKNDWDGTYNGQPLAEGAYVYVIDSGEGTGLLRGTVNIIRDQR